MRVEKIIKKTLKVILYIVGGIICFIILVLLLLNTNYARRFIRDKAQSYLVNKIHAKVVIGSIDYSLPTKIEIKDLLIEDQRNDTLLSGGKLAVNMNMLKLIWGEIYIDKIGLENIKANILRPANDSNYNFQFIVDAFTGAKTNQPKKDTSSLNITLKEFELTNFSFQYKDDYAGNNINTSVSNLDITMNAFKPDKMLFDINGFKTNHLVFSMLSFKTANSSAGSNPSDTTSKNNLQLSINKTDFSDISVSIDNRVNGMFYSNYFKHLAVNNTNLKMATQAVAIDKILLDSSSIKFISPKPQQVTKENTLSSSSSSWAINLKSVQLNNGQVQFDNNEFAQQPTGIDPSHIGLTRLKINAANILYSSDSIKATINQLAFKEKSGFTIDTTHANLLYSNKNISVAELYLKTPQSLLRNAVALRYDSLAGIMNNPKTTFVSAKLQHSTIAVNDMYLLMPSVKKYLPEDKFKNNAIAINTQVEGTLAELTIPFLQLSGLSGTQINARAVLYNVTDTKNLGYDIYVFNSHIPKNDLSKFIIKDKYIDKLPPGLNLTTHIKGNAKQTSVAINFESDAFKLAGTVQVKNMENPNALQYTIHVDNSMIKKDFLMAYVPQNTIPSSIQLPDVMLLKGNISGDMNNVQPDLTLGGSYGTLAVKGFVHNFKNEQSANYAIQFSATDFAAGKLLKQDSMLGNITLTSNAKGTGFNYKTMNAVINIHVDEAGVNNYTYHDITANTTLNAGAVQSDGSINDSNVNMQYIVAANLSGDYPSLASATITIDTLQLQKLKLYPDPLNASCKIHFKANTLDPKKLDLYASIDTVKLNLENKPYSFDSIIAKATTSNGIHDITFRSPLADMNASGSFDYDKIGISLSQFIGKYYDLGIEHKENISAQQIKFDGVIKNHPLITGLVSGLTYTDITFKGGYSSGGGDSALKLDVSVPQFSYQSYKIKSGKINIASFNSRIDYNLLFNELHFNDRVFYATSVKGDVANDSLNIYALTKDAKNKDWFGIGAAISARDRHYTVSLTDKLIINYQKWSVPGDNKLSYSSDGILVHDLVLENNKTKISINSKEDKLNSPVDIDISNFDIKDIASIAGGDTLLASGIINAKIEAGNFEKTLPSFTGDFTIDKLAFMGQPIGDVKLTAENKDESAVSGTLQLSGNNNSVQAKGEYNLNSGEFNAELTIDTLKMNTLQAFTAGNMSRASGNVNGKMSLSGTFSEPKWNGSLNFDSAKFTVSKTGAAYSIDKQKIQFDYPSIAFSHFTIKDSTGNAFTLDGSVTAQSLTNYDLSLNISAKNFIVVNTPKAIDNQVYGFASATADVSISGNSDAPDIEGNVSLNKKSNVTLVLPEQNIDKDAAKSVVRFIDKDTFALPENVLFTPAGDTTSNESQYLKYNLDIKIDREATLTVVIDPSTGDELQVKGDADLNAGVDPGGHIVLAGNYELDSGYYILNYEFLQRKFNLLKGSTIAFTGDIMSSQIDITAKYIANTAPSDLLDNEISGIDSKTSAMFNQKIPFEVLLHLKGKIKKPDISFDIQLPDESSNVPISSELREAIENKLVQMRSDVAITNKEVFSLLLLGRFVGEQSSDFFKGNDNGGGLNDVARQSVSGFLSTAMNQIASDIFKGVNVDLNLNSTQDYSTGTEQQQTNLDVAVSKNFINDRLTVTAGKSFDVEGQDAGAAAAVQENSSNLPDLTLNYKLTQDGKYLMRAYKKDQYDVIVDGFVTETGVAFVVTMDYDKFKELFHKKKHKKNTPGKK